MTDDFMDRVYVRNTYDCFHFVREVWAHITGEDISTRLHHLMEAAARKVRPSHVRHITKLAEPVTPCLCLMRKNTGEMHIGIYWNERIFHLQSYGAALQPVNVATHGFESYQYFK
jgi:hypothetical protein